MKTKRDVALLGWAIALTVVCALPFDSRAQHVNVERNVCLDRVQVRQTIPDPLAVKRKPLTSDRLNTTSTRLVDARRGLRPYSSVFAGGYTSRQGHGVVVPGCDDLFGVSRPERRPYAYACRASRTSVSVFRNDDNSRLQRLGVDSVGQSGKLALQATSADVVPTKQDLKIRIHRDRSATPTTRGAVLIRSDGTVLQIGD